MKHIGVIVVLVAVVLSLACQPLQIVADLVATPTPVPRQTAPPAFVPVPTSLPLATYAPIPTNAQFPTLAALATLQALPSPTTRPTTAVPATLVRAALPTPTPPNIPTGWRVSLDPSGACRVATPPDWQPGKDFFLAAEQAAPSPLAGVTGNFPPRGAALWGASDPGQLPEGVRFQVRQSLVIGDKVCSVWRIQESTDFTAAEKSEMEQVGKTLQEVH